MNIDHTKHSRLADRFKNNVLLEEMRTVRLGCGHEARGYPVAIYPSRRELWRCPQGCGLIRATRRIWRT